MVELVSTRFVKQCHVIQQVVEWILFHQKNDEQQQQQAREQYDGTKGARLNVPTLTAFFIFFFIWFFPLSLLYLIA